MGCLGSLINLIISLLKIFIYIITFIITLIIKIIKYIIKSKKEKQRRDNKYVIKNNYQYQDYNKKAINNTTNITKETNNNITNSYSYLKIYINKKYKELIKDNEFNYKLLEIESYDMPYIYYDDTADIKGYNLFEAEESSSEKYGNLLEKIYLLCKSDFYATIGYKEKEITYKIKIQDNKIYINDNDEIKIKNKYNNLKNKIISFSEILSEYYLNTNNTVLYYSIIPNNDIDCDNIIDLSDKLKGNNNILLFEIPYMEEISSIIDIIKPKIIKEIEKYEKELQELSIFKEYKEENITHNKSINKKKKQLSWKELEFEKEADLWGLSKEERRIAKEEGMTPAEYIEAEEYDDDELLLDEWER